MFIAGTERWKVTIAEPEALRIGLYIRDAAALDPLTEPVIPPLDPPCDVWPVWSRRPVDVPASGGVRLLGGRDINRMVASGQWARWWTHALDVGAGAIDDLRPPGFLALSGVPNLRALVQRHFHNANLWSDGVNDDPRTKHALSAPAAGINTIIRELPDVLGRRPAQFSMRITVIGVQTKHAWMLAPDHVLMTRHLVADIDNVVDWLRPRILALG